MEFCTIFQGVFGLWGWECVADDGELIEECHQVFETREACVKDAGRHGYRPIQNPDRSQSQGASAAVPVLESNALSDVAA